jgi:hypothetical protein
MFKRLKLAPNQCISGDDVLEQHRMEKENAEKLIGTYTGLNIEDFLYEFKMLKVWASSRSFSYQIFNFFWIFWRTSGRVG